MRQETNDRLAEIEIVESGQIGRNVFSIRLALVGNRLWRSLEPKPKSVDSWTEFARRPDFLLLRRCHFHELPISAQSLENHGFRLLCARNASLGQEGLTGSFKFPQGTGRPSQVAVLARQARGEIAPTTREIQQASGIASQNSVIQFLRALERKGLVRTLPGKARGVVAVSPPTEPPSRRPDLGSLFIDVPLFGEIRGEGSAGGPSPLPATLPVYAPTMRLTHRSRPFAWRIHGDSLKDVCIQDADYVVFDAECQPRPGDVVAVFLDGVTTLKRYVVIGDQTYLKAENT